MDRFESLNNGLAATTNLNECLKIDQEHLFKVVIGPLCNQSLLDEMMTAIADSQPSGILPRMRVTGKVLAETFGAANALQNVYSVLSQHVSDTVRGWACFILPQQLPELSLPELLTKIQPHAKDAHFGVREWVWMAARGKLELDLAYSIELLSPWVVDPQPFIRRFAVESLRPRGVWCRHINKLKEQPAIALPLLEPLKNEPEIYVQDSVANWLNDASKSQPQWVSNICEKWLTESNSKSTQRIVKRALRSISKSK
ncbi:DNA alkylation repair protein [Klebsiella michiganensis]|uniref:DNA alkylation repair protein n=1 Tax=Klebsiella michiganensis TaxID=1134687 RepID=A0A6P1V0U7_9ENTR|nr:DNA alkylation repair protein [Klebsiella michiganensis]QHS47552.1 DNA alkylation repair protein [Klebsiella michiganensis]HDX8940793.1 DNA alkylation repair protein [Klebsiella michiganensis]